MAEYEFNVIVKEIPGGSLEDWSEKLFAAGGEFDLLPGVSNGIPDVDVACEADSLQQAIANAVRLVRSTGAVVTGVELHSESVDAITAAAAV